VFLIGRGGCCLAHGSGNVITLFINAANFLSLLAFTYADATVINSAVMVCALPTFPTRLKAFRPIFSVFDALFVLCAHRPPFWGVSSCCWRQRRAMAGPKLPPMLNDRGGGGFFF